VSAEKLMRLRCPLDDGGARHLAVDVHLPVSLAELPRIVERLGECHCGARMEILTDPSRDRRGAA
jgi:hypothetical protein